MIPVYQHDVRWHDVWAVAKQMLWGSIGPHKRVEELERLISARYRDREAIVTTSGTTALMLALWAAGLERDDAVLVPAWTNHAAADVATMLGFRVRCVDVDPSTGCMNMESLKGALVRHGARAVVFVHHNGPYASEAMTARAVCDTQGAVLIEDGCQAFGELRTVAGRMAAFSFAPMKQLTTGQGGVVVTDDAVTADLLRDIRGGGRHDGPIGGNFRMPDVLAAWGIAQMSRLDATLARRRQMRSWYREGGVPVRLGSWCVVYRTPRADKLIARLSQHGVQSVQFFQPIWARREYRAMARPEHFPGAADAERTWVYLPSGPRLKRRDVAKVCQLVREHETAR